VLCSLLLLSVAAIFQSAAAAGLVDVSGRSLLRDGRPWVPHGVTVVGLLPPSPSKFPIYAEAQKHWGPAELNAIRAYGANVIRFQVSQPGLDPESPIYSPEYLQRLRQAVEEARRQNFTVILSVQAQGGAGLPNLPTMPDGSTERAWRALAPVFARDTGVMYELFNEPIVKDVPRDDWRAIWARWHQAFQQLITLVRSLGAQNVLVIDGVQTANFLGGAPTLQDPLNRLAFAVHPYLTGANKGPAAWDRNFGQFAASHPVIVTEWNATSRGPCRADTPTAASEFITYAREKRIGIIGWAFDVPGTLVRNYNYAPTTYSGFRCGAPDGGAGQLLRESFGAAQ
jgi:hypothetical protein